MQPIILQPLSEPVSNAVRAMIEFDATGERNPLLFIYTSNPALEEKLIEFCPLNPLTIGKDGRVIVEEDYISGDASKSRDESPAEYKERMRKTLARAKGFAEKRKPDLAKLLADPSFSIALFPPSI